MNIGKILGQYDTPVKRNQATLALFEMVQAGVAEPLAVEVVKQIFAKPEVVRGERNRLVAEAIAQVKHVERAVTTPAEVRTNPTDTIEDILPPIEDRE